MINSLSNHKSTRDEQPGYWEFVILMAAMTALDALSIDSMMPALAQIHIDLQMATANHRQWIITTLFLGFSVGVLIFGFVADSIGRRIPTLSAFGLYAIGTVICMQADSLSVMLLGRACQGFGAAGPYVLAIAIVRDAYHGRRMARVMSLIMMVFIGAPIVAPFMGQLVLMLAGWRTIFAVLLSYSVIIALWFWWRQPETLRAENRIPIKPSVVWSNAVEVLSHTHTRAYTFAMALAGGAFIAYLSTAQQIFQDIYQTGNRFPLVFASLASTVALSSWINSRLVGKLGMAHLLGYALLGVSAVSLVFLMVSFLVQGLLPFWIYYLYLAVVIFCYGLIFGNLTSLALEPMGHIAGAASSIVNSAGTIGSIVVASIIGMSLRETVIPLVTGFGIACFAAWWLVKALRRPVTVSG